MRKRYQHEGQAITEFVVTLPLFLALLVAVFYLGECVVWWQRTSMAARYSAWRYARKMGDHQSGQYIHKRYFLGSRSATYSFGKARLFGQTENPRRHPVIAYVFDQPSSTITRSVSRDT